MTWDWEWDHRKWSGFLGFQRSSTIFLAWRYFHNSIKFLNFQGILWGVCPSTDITANWDDIMWRDMIYPVFMEKKLSLPSITTWWFQSIWKILSSQIGLFPQGSGWTVKKYLKPRPGSNVGVSTKHSTWNWSLTLGWLGIPRSVRCYGVTTSQYKEAFFYPVMCGCRYSAICFPSIVREYVTHCHWIWAN